MPVDYSGFERKKDLAQRLFDRNVPKLIEDAGQYLSARLVEEVLNGATGTDYPKPYPASVTEGERGFVGVINSYLRRSIGEDKVNRFEVQIRQVNQTLAPYHDEVVAWSAQKYGRNFYQIAVELYGHGVAKQIIAYLTRLAKDVESLRQTAYRNPFPG